MLDRFAADCQERIAPINREAPELLEALKTAKETIRAWHGPNAYERALDAQAGAS